MKRSTILLILLLLLLAVSISVVFAQETPADPCRTGVQIPNRQIPGGGNHFDLFYGADKNGKVGIVVMLPDAQNHGRCAIYVGPDELAKLPAKPATNMLLGTFEDTSLYKLTSGEFQVNHGPDVQGKVNVVVFGAKLHEADFFLATK